MAIALVQQAGVAGVNTTSPHSISITSTGGNTLIVTGHFFNSGSTSNYPASVTDSASNTWHVSTTTAQNPPTAQIIPAGGAQSDFIAWCVGASAVTSVTVSCQNTASIFWRVAVTEWSGIVQFDNSWSGTVPTTAVSPWSMGPVTITSGEMIIGAAAPAAGTPGIPTSWTALTAPGSSVQAYWLSPPAGSYSPAWKTSGNVAELWSGTLAVFSPTAITSQGTATLTGAGSVTANVTQGSSATLGGVGVAGTPGTYGSGTYGSGVYGGGISGVDAVQSAPAAFTGAGVLTAGGGSTVQGTASLTSAGSLTVAAVQFAPAALTGAGVLTAVPGSNVQGSASLTGAGTLTVLAVQRGSATFAGTGALAAIPGAFVNGSATLTGAGVVVVLAVQGAPTALPGTGVLTALAAPGAVASLNGAGAVTAQAGQRGPFNVATSHPVLVPFGTSAATVTDPRDGKPSVS